MKMRVLLAFCALFIGTSVLAQDAEEKAIRQTIQNYFDGYNKGDVALLEKAFHPSCVIKYLDLKSGKYSTLTMDQLNQFMRNLPKGWKSVPKLFSLEYHGSAAQAKVSVTIMGGALTWTDFLNLLKIDGQWKIVDKISHGDFDRSKMKKRKK